MTQTSFLVGRDRTTAGFANPPHDPGPYTSLEWRERQRILHAGDRYNGSGTPVDAVGVMASYLNRLAVTVTPSGPDVVNVNTGACFVDGNIMRNSASVQIPLPGSPTPGTYTVVAVLNDSDSPYVTSIISPLYETTANSIPARSCRLAILTAGPAGLKQESTIFMVALYTFDTDGSGNITNLTDVRSYLDAGIKRLYVQCIGGYDSTAASDAVFGAGAVGYGMPNNALTRLNGHFAIPNDYISGMTATPIIWHPNTTTGDVYVDNTVNYGACGEVITAHNAASGLTAITIANNVNRHCLADVTLSLSSAALDDYAWLELERDATDPTDTFEGAVYLLGWYVDYLGFRR